MKNDYPTVYMPSTGKPAPPLLTEEEVIELMRLDEEGPRYPDQALRRYRNLYPEFLKGVQIGKRVRFRLVGVLRVIEAIEDDNPR